MRPLQICLLLFLSLASSATSYNILLMFSFGTRSHKNAMNGIIHELAKRGHQVTSITPIKETDVVKGVKEVYLSKVAEEWSKFQETFFDGTPGDPQVLKKISDFCFRLCNATYNQEEEVKKLLQNPKHGYDVLIVDAIFNDFLLPIGHHLGIPTVVASPGGVFTSLAMGMNIPTPLSYIDSGIGYIDSWPMNFTDKLKSLFINLMMHYTRHTSFFHGFEEIISKVLPNSPPIAQVERNISLLISNTHPAIHHSRPLMPYYKEVACLHCKPAKPLPKELEDFMQSSGKYGVIYFSLGSVTKGESMPLEMRDKIIKGFAQLPQKILWKYEKGIEGLPKNIRLTKWAPQQDLLAHNKTRLFITHGGGLSTLEAVYHGCPVLGFPLGAEQMGNTGRAVHKGYAEALQWRTFTTEDFVEKVRKILDNKSYQQTVDKLSAILKDQPVRPQEKAAYWIEYVIRHKGAFHLKSEAEHLNFFQYFMLDIISCLLLIGLVAIFVVYIILKKLFKMIFAGKSKVTTDKKRR